MSLIINYLMLVCKSHITLPLMSIKVTFSGPFHPYYSQEKIKKCLSKDLYDYQGILTLFFTCPYRGKGVSVL